MRAAAANLGLFVPGHFPEPSNPFAGMGDFVPGLFAVPENPVMRGMGDFVSGRFAVPENPVLRGARRAGLGCAGCGGGCSKSATGLGDISSDFSAMVAGTAAPETYALYIGGAAVALWLFTSMGGSKRGRRG